MVKLINKQQFIKSSYFLLLLDDTHKVAMAAYNIIRSKMTTDTLVRILKVLVYRFLPLSPHDLELWECDPEEYRKSFEYI